MALSAAARYALGVGIASPLVAKEIGDAMDATAAAGTNTWTGANTFTGGVTLTGTGLTLTDVNVIATASTGSQIATNNAQKIALWGATPVVQPSTTGELLGLNGNAATAANATNMNSNGNVGSTLYGFNDLIKALKQAGVIKS